MRGWYEFFAGGGLARLGLGPMWDCLFANDCCEKKAVAYRLNFGASPELAVKRIQSVVPEEIPDGAVLSWASFPCQDLSLAGRRSGFQGQRSSAFWDFWRLMEAKRTPILVLENVVGAATSRGGQDFLDLLGAIVEGGYRVGPVVMDAVRFVPQSRPRLFVVAVRRDIPISPALVSATAASWHPDQIQRAYDLASPEIKQNWIWWFLPDPPERTAKLADLIDQRVDRWHSDHETRQLLNLMSDTNSQKVGNLLARKSAAVGTAYRRTRNKVQRVECRFDGISGCLRTPSGGSSRQIVLVIHRGKLRSRLLTTREAARLMGADDYILPERYNDAYHVMGDAVVVPVVNWLERHIISPLAETYEELLAVRPHPALMPQLDAAPGLHV